jgi:hypothetical protein
MNSTSSSHPWHAFALGLNNRDVSVSCRELRDQPGRA